MLAFILFCQAGVAGLGLCGVWHLLTYDGTVTLRAEDWQGILCSLVMATVGLFIFYRALLYWCGKYTYDDHSIEFVNLKGTRVKNSFSELRNVHLPESMNLFTSRIFPAHSLSNIGMTFRGVRLDFASGDFIVYFPLAAPESFNRFIYEKAVAIGVDVEHHSLRHYLFIDYYDSLK